MTGHDPQPATPSAEPQPATTRQKVVVYSTVIVSLLMAVGLMAGIGIQWMNQRTPSSIVVFHANAALVDGVIEILGEDGSHRPDVSINQTAEFTTPVFLEAGRYMFTVKKSRKVVFQDSMYVAEGCRYDVNLVSPTSP